jgi:hypothetical protein
MLKTKYFIPALSVAILILLVGSEAKSGIFTWLKPEPAFQTQVNTSNLSDLGRIAACNNSREAYRTAKADFETKQRLMNCQSGNPQTPSAPDPVTQIFNRINQDSSLTSTRRNNCTDWFTTITQRISCSQITFEDINRMVLTTNNFNLFDPSGTAERTACAAIVLGYVSQIEAQLQHEAQNHDADLNLNPSDLAYLQSNSLLDLARQIIAAEKAICECFPNASDRPEGVQCS